jgi:hypothetical protein
MINFFIGQPLKFAALIYPARGRDPLNRLN